VIDRLPVTMALSALLASATPWPVGRGTKPNGAIPPYLLLYSVDAQTFGAPLADENEQAEYIYQVTSVSGPDPTHPGSTGIADQSELMGDKVRKAILGRDPATGLWLHKLTIPGVSVMCRELDVEAGGTNDPTDGIMSYVQRFKLGLTPA
jgi:hypothetical protein